VSKKKSNTFWKFMIASQPEYYLAARMGVFGEGAKASAEELEPVYAIMGAIVLILGAVVGCAWLFGFIG
jgi:hypothetical protein